MIGATIVTVVTQGAAPVAFPLVVGVLAATVGYGRRAVSPGTTTLLRSAVVTRHSHSSSQAV